MRASEVAIIERGGLNYPKGISEQGLEGCFPHLLAIGNPDLLHEKLLALFCSKKCPGEAVLRTYDLARALWDAGVPVISGFHTPMEKECLDLRLRGTQPIVICPARSVHSMRIPSAWRTPLSEGRLLVLSPFEARYRRHTAELAEQRNRFVGQIAHRTLVIHAAPQSKTGFCASIS